MVSVAWSQRRVASRRSRVHAGWLAGWLAGHAIVTLSWRVLRSLYHHGSRCTSIFNLHFSRSLPLLSSFRSFLSERSRAREFLAGAPIDASGTTLSCTALGSPLVLWPFCRASGMRAGRDSRRARSFTITEGPGAEISFCLQSFYFPVIFHFWERTIELYRASTKTKVSFFCDVTRDLTSGYKCFFDTFYARVTDMDLRTSVFVFQWAKLNTYNKAKNLVTCYLLSLPFHFTKSAVGSWMNEV